MRGSLSQLPVPGLVTPAFGGGGRPADWALAAFSTPTMANTPNAKAMFLVERSMFGRSFGNVRPNSSVAFLVENRLLAHCVHDTQAGGLPIIVGSVGGYSVSVSGGGSVGSRVICVCDWPMR